MVILHLRWISLRLCMKEKMRFLFAWITPCSQAHAGILVQVLTRDVWLEKRHPIHIARYGMYLTTDEGNLNISTTLHTSECMKDDDSLSLTFYVKKIRMEKRLQKGYHIEK